MEKSLTSSEYFKSLQFFHTTLSLTSLLLVVLGLLFSSNDSTFAIKNKENEQQILYYIGGYSIVSILFAKWLLTLITFPYVRNQKYLKHKLNKYKKILKIQYFILFIAYVICFIAYLIWNNYFLLFFSFITLAFIILSRPDRYRTIRFKIE
jgi:hypothetical protein